MIDAREGELTFCGRACDHEVLKTEARFDFFVARCGRGCVCEPAGAGRD
jgi:hypothetical protein